MFLSLRLSRKSESEREICEAVGAEMVGNGIEEHRFHCRPVGGLPKHEPSVTPVGLTLEIEKHRADRVPRSVDVEPMGAEAVVAA